MKIGLLIPSTSNGREWKNGKESYLYKITIKSFILSTLEDKEKHNYIFYIGIDKEDKILDTVEFKHEVNRLIMIFKNIEIKYYYMDGIAKGHLTVMWNVLFKEALKDGCDYFFQCGDDIEFQTKGWINDCIKQLQTNNNIGLTGPINNNARILTQSFVSRKHYDLFGYYFPEEIINWFCDDWINEVYKGLNAYFPLQSHLCINIGGPPRYTINNDSTINLNFNRSVNIMREKCTHIVKRDLMRVSFKNMSH
jgi:hypothetical protein